MVDTMRLLEKESGIKCIYRMEQLLCRDASIHDAHLALIQGIMQLILFLLVIAN